MSTIDNIAAKLTKVEIQYLVNNPDKLANVWNDLQVPKKQLECKVGDCFYTKDFEFLKVYWKTVEWMNANGEEAAQLCSDFNAECGTTLLTETASLYLAQDPYYSAEEVLKSMTEKSAQGDYSIMEENLLGILNFFISTGKYNEGDDQKTLGHLDTKLMEDVCASIG